VTAPQLLKVTGKGTQIAKGSRFIPRAAAVARKGTTVATKAGKGAYNVIASGARAVTRPQVVSQLGGVVKSSVAKNLGLIALGGAAIAIPQIAYDLGSGAGREQYEQDLNELADAQNAGREEYEQELQSQADIAQAIEENIQQDEGGFIDDLTQAGLDSSYYTLSDDSGTGDLESIRPGEEFEIPPTYLEQPPDLDPIEEADGYSFDSLAEEDESEPNVDVFNLEPQRVDEEVEFESDFEPNPIAGIGNDESEVEIDENFEPIELSLGNEEE
jgi:hypothetical protein